MRHPNFGPSASRCGRPRGGRVRLVSSRGCADADLDGEAAPGRASGGTSGQDARGQDLLVQDVGVAGVLGEFAQHLQVERPHRALTPTLDDVVKSQCGHRRARPVAPSLVSGQDM